MPSWDALRTPVVCAKRLRILPHPNKARTRSRHRRFATDSSFVRQGERMSVKQSEGLAHPGPSYSIRIVVAVALGTVAMLSSTLPVSAADADAAGPSSAAASSPVLEEITVTGSRIRRRDLE